jgi:hypothetical protein
MSYLSRREYELGDVDPVDTLIGRETRRDHQRATARGRRLLLIADAVVSVLEARSLITDPATVRREVFHGLVNELYSDATSIDLPDFSTEQSLDAMRSGKSG